MTTAAKRIVVSGATSGIGRACAAELARRGERVWVLGSRPESARRTMAEIGGLAGGGWCDLRDPDAVEAAVQEAAAELGGLDGAFVNAGIDGVGASVMELTAADFRDVLDVNVVGAFSFARAVAATIESAGAIVFNASVNALRPEPLFADYNASKAAVVSLSQTMALELAPRGITVSAICPGYVPTPMTAAYLDDAGTAAQLLSEIPAGRLGTAEEIAALVCFLFSSDAAYMAGAVISINGGRCV